MVVKIWTQDNQAGQQLPKSLHYSSLKVYMATQKPVLIEVWTMCCKSVHCTLHHTGSIRNKGLTSSFNTKLATKNRTMYYSNTCFLVVSAVAEIHSSMILSASLRHSRSFGWVTKGRLVFQKCLAAAITRSYFPALLANLSKDSDQQY